MSSSPIYRRLARHFVARLVRDRAVDAIERAVERGLLEGVHQTNGATLFRVGGRIAGWALARVRLLVSQVFGSRSPSSPAVDGGASATARDAGVLDEEDEALLDSGDWLAPDHDADDEAGKSARLRSPRKQKQAAASAADAGSASSAEAVATRDVDSTSDADGQKTRARRRRQQRLDRMTLLRLVRGLSTPPAATQVATLLLLADAVARSGHSLTDVLAILRRPKPIVAITGTVPGFEAAFLELLRCGLVLPGSSSFLSGYDLRSINEHRRNDVTARRLVLFRGEENPENAKLVAQQVSLAVQNDYPVLAIADDPGQLPEALVSTADLNLVCTPLSPGLIAEVMQVVLGDTATLPSGIADRLLQLDGCEALSLADLGLAIRPGMAAERSVELLRVLIGRARDRQTASAAASASTGGDQSSSSVFHDRRAGIGSGSTIIEPEPIAAEELADDGRVPSGKTPLRVETLAGYGEAQDWALALKADLDLWKSGRLDWSDMSTRLLLAGPPGTGKTTFARALANSLQLKLFTTSVASWLEPSHLGDVLARMAAAFAEAQAHAPCILFIDEIDGIGRRGNGIAWLDDAGPVEGHVLIVLLIAHCLGKWETERNLKEAIAKSGKKITFDIQAQIVLENRKSYRNGAHVLWPTELPNHALVHDYVAAQRYPFEPRTPLANPETNIFSSEEGRQLLEREFLLAGLKIRGFCRNPSHRVRPFGYGRYGLGFGSTLVTYRNCPNNAPLALWWGDPHAAAGHPFRRWYPLLPRRTYEQGVDADDFDF